MSILFKKKKKTHKFIHIEKGIFTFVIVMFYLEFKAIIEAFCSSQ